MNPKLYVGNLSFRTSEDALRETFGVFGQVTDVHLPSDRETGRPRGFAFVTFSTAAEAQVACEKLNGTELDGRALTINEAREAGGTTSISATGRVYSSPNRRPGAFQARGKKRR